ncbi:MAG: hypothetical protein ABSE21_07350 [Bryobacteraceae bacterium]|jgi:hypothetical protein
MRIGLFPLGTFFVVSAFSLAQEQKPAATTAPTPLQTRTQVRVIAGLTGEDGTVRFLPRVKIRILKGACSVETGNKTSALAEGETSLHGEALLTVPQGSYRLCAGDTTTRHHYRWDLPVRAKGKEVTLELSDTNALTAGAPEAPARYSAAVIEGDIYLLMESGDVRRGAGLAVHLLRDPDATAKLLASNCDQFQSLNDDLERRQAAARAAATKAIGSSSGEFERRLEEESRLSKLIFELFDKTTASADKILLDASMSKSNSGVNSHFKFDGVPAGDYALWARFPIGDRWYQWFIPVTVAPGEHVVRDLDTASMNRRVVYCGIK